MFIFYRFIQETLSPSTAPAFSLKPSSVPPSISVESRCVHGQGTALPQAGGGGCFMKSSYSHSWKTLAPSPSATFLGEIISKKPPIFTQIVVVTGSRCLLLCNRVCLSGSEFQMCSVGSGCLLCPLWAGGAASSPCWPRGAAASLAEGIAPGPWALLLLVPSATASLILGARLGVCTSLWDTSKRNWALVCSALHGKEGNHWQGVRKSL